MADDDFTIWLGHVGKDRPLRYELAKAANRAGKAARSSARRARRFDGSRIGRGAGVGRLLGYSDRFSGYRARRVVVKARFVKLAGKGAKAAAAHLRYLQRDGTTREGERGSLYGPDSDRVDGKAFLEKGKGDRHQFRFIVAPEDGSEYRDLQSVTRRLMRQMEQDLGTGLDWVAVDHFNTGHPHSHVVLKGTDDQGKNLIIAREYISRGIAMRAAEIVNMDLGPRTTLEIMAMGQREMRAERFTGIDRRLLQSRDELGLVSAAHRDPAEQTLRAGRLATLSRMGLAEEVGQGRYRLDSELEPTLKAMGRRGDIIATMHRELKERQVNPQDYAIYEPSKGQTLVGEVIAQGLSDEHADRRYLILETSDGRSHYVELGGGAIEDAAQGNLIRISAMPVEVKEVDRTVAEIAAANGGSYSLDMHLRHDPSAGERFVEAHIRRLEAVRRGSGQVERLSDGTWLIRPDHLQRVLAWERARTTQRPVTVALLADRPLDQLAHHEGATWLDEQCVTREPEPLQGRLGAKVKQALDLRRQWLIEQGLAEQDGSTIRYRANLLQNLRQRELRRVAGQLSRELGLDYAEHQGGYLEGRLRKPVTIGGNTYALIERSHEFTLVPWRPVLEKQIGRHVEGLDRGGSITWTFGRGRSGPEIG